MLNILFTAKPTRWETFRPHLHAALDKAGLDYTLGTEFAPQDVDYIVYAPNGHITDLAPYTNTKAVLSLWAGVEGIVSNATLTQPLCRMVDHGLTEGMVEWVTGHALRHHLGMDRHIHGQGGAWLEGAPPLARDRMASLHFDVHGWSRRPKDVANITCHHGEAGLKNALNNADIVILLLPDTPATTNIINAETLSLLAPDAAIINPGRGPLIDDDALIAALDPK